MSRLHHQRGVGLLLGGALLWVVGCGDSTSPSADTTSAAPASEPAATGGPVSTTATIPSGVNLTADIRFSADLPGAYPALLDVYAPDGARDLPMVVMFHGGGVDKRDLQYPLIAGELAARGMVVVVPNHGPLDGVVPTDDPVGTVVSYMDGAACAMSYAVAHGSEWGADPTRIVLFGHSGGANTASVLMFTYSRAVGTGCAEPAQQWQPQVVALWDGEIALLDEGLWHNYPDDLQGLFAELTNWNSTAAAVFDGPVHLFSTTSFNAEARRCDEMATWTAARDPSGTLQAALAAVGADDDGCVDIGEVHRAYAWHLDHNGVRSYYAEFTAEGSEHAELADPDLDLLFDTLTAAADATLSNTSGQGH